MGATASKIAGSMGRPREKPEVDTDKFRGRFALRLYELALASELTNKQIAKRMKLPVVTVAKWFRGENAPDIDHWPKLANILGVSVRDLLPAS